MKDRKNEESHREVYNPDFHQVDCTKVRASDVKNNPRVIFSKPRSPKEEAELTTRQEMVNNIVEQYM